MKKLLIVTDAWEPQTNGVVRTLKETICHLQNDFDIKVIEPSQFTSIPVGKKEDIRWSLFPHRKLSKLIDEFNPHYIHLSVEGPLGRAGRKYCLERGYDFTTAYHTMFPEYLKVRYGIPLSVGYRIMRNFHSQSSRIMVACDGLDALLIDHDFPALRLARWTRGVDTELFHPKWRAHGASPGMVNEPFALYVGRVSREKNIEAFLEADTGILTKVVVGDGPELASLKSRYKNVAFMGVQKGQNLVNFYANADVFVFPSITDTFGLVMIEAMSCGTPVAALPSFNTSSIVQPHVGAINADLSIAIREAQRAARRNCREYVLQNYTWEIASNQFKKNLVSVR